MDAVKLNDMDRRRDPTQARTEWILNKLAVRPHSWSELERLSKKNGLGFAQSTYSRDMVGLRARRLVFYNDVSKMWTIDREGTKYLEKKKIDVGIQGLQEGSHPEARVPG